MKGLIPVVLLVGLLSACSDSARIRSDINRLEASITDLRNYQAEQTTKITSLETQLRTISGKVEEIEYSQSQRVGSALNTLQSDLSTLRKRVPPPPIVPAEALEQDEAAITSLPAEIATPFGTALQQIREGSFERALSPLDEAYSLSEGTDWAPQMLFWSAVAYDGMNESKKALEMYHEIVTRFRKYRRVPLVLLRQASVFIRMGDTKIARLTLNKLIADYPKSPEAARARERLKDI